MVETIFSQHAYFARFLKEIDLQSFHNFIMSHEAVLGMAWVAYTRGMETETRRRAGGASLRVLSRGNHG